MEHPRSAEIHKILRHYWNYDSFRPLQEDIILSVMDGRDTLALLPTGGGKSICFQVPALALGGLCVVVSPLIALMKDQVAHLRARHIKATAIYSGMSDREIQDAVSNVLFDPEYRFLYVSPERLLTETFKMNFQRMPVRMIAVDEAHCISQWGYDFRPPYLEIARIRKCFPEAPVLALTATATPEVVVDIQQKLAFKQENVFQKSFKRDNLTYFVVREEDKNGRMLRIMQRYPGTGIVYVRNRRKTAEVAEFLRKNGVSADFYHAGLDPKTRDARQNAWMTGQIRVIVATNAFGMGIDKPDVRFVVHIDLPDTLEAYFQEAGRGGRDEKPAVAILLYDQYDLRQLERSFTMAFPPLEKVRAVYEYLCQTFYLEMGSGKNSIFPFYMEKHASALGMPIPQFFNAILLLEKAGVIALSEHLRDCSQVHFLMNGDQLLDYERDNPDQAELVKLILRSYGGVFTQYVDVSEQLLATRAEMTPQEVVERLHLLKRQGVLAYQPQSNIPLIVFLQDRISNRYVYFEPAVYELRKQKARQRIDAVRDYVTSDSICRSQRLLAYFGETNSLPCGDCDVCRKRSDKLNHTTYSQIAEEVGRLRKEGVGEAGKIVGRLSKYFEESEIEYVIRWMIDNNTF